MTELRDASIGILLMRCGTWMIGVDALSVRAIRPPRAGDKALDIGKFLRVEGPLPPADAKVPPLADKLAEGEIRGPHSGPEAGLWPAAGRGTGSTRRVVELGGEGDRVTFSIDNALGTRSLGLAEVRPLPAVLEHYGAPSWWVGTAEEDGELVLLVDLSALATAARGTA